jgi:hypothetical protein
VGSLLGIRLTQVSLQRREKQTLNHRIGIQCSLAPRFFFFALVQVDRLSELRTHELLIPIFTGKYPIFTSFADWRFPQSLPMPWQHYTIPESPETRRQAHLQERDRSCWLTLHEDGCEVAHLIPKAEAVWFARNRMMHYHTSIPAMFMRFITPGT